ncbi:hypothetical protein HYR69_12185 [Candidatus Sumerlaeota bacterium]|nr:hypothetical protein [Candidatus Sumerlaeota bacterium]
MSLLFRFKPVHLAPGEVFTFSTTGSVRLQKYFLLGALSLMTVAITLIGISPLLEQPKTEMERLTGIYVSIVGGVGVGVLWLAVYLLRNRLAAYFTGGDYTIDERGIEYRAAATGEKVRIEWNGGVNFAFAQNHIVIQQRNRSIEISKFAMPETGLWWRVNALLKNLENSTSRSAIPTEGIVFSTETPQNRIKLTLIRLLLPLLGVFAIVAPTTIELSAGSERYLSHEPMGFLMQSGGIFFLILFLAALFRESPFQRGHWRFDHMGIHFRPLKGEPIFLPWAEVEKIRWQSRTVGFRGRGENLVLSNIWFRAQEWANFKDSISRYLPEFDLGIKHQSPSRSAVKAGLLFLLTVFLLLGLRIALERKERLVWWASPFIVVCNGIWMVFLVLLARSRHQKFLAINPEWHERRNPPPPTDSH